MSQFNLTGDITVKDSRFNRAIGRIQAKLQRVGAALDRVAGHARRMLVASTAVGAGAVYAFGKFEQSMARVKAISGATGEEFSALNETAQKLGATTSFSASESADAMGNLAVAGFKTSEIISTMPGLLNLAAAGQLDIATASDITARALRGMGLEADQSGRVADVMAKAFTSANLDLNDLGESLKMAAPSAVGAGKSIEETTAVLMSFAQAGIRGSMAGSGLSRMLNAISGNSNVHKLFKDLGIEIADAQGKMRPLADIIDDMNATMGDMGRVEKAGLLAKAFGAEATRDVNALMAQGGDQIRQFQKSLEQAGGTAEKIAKVQLDTLWGRFTLLKSAVEGAAISIGEILAPYLAKMVEWVTKSVDWFNNLSPAIKSIIVGSGVAATALAGITAALAVLVPIVAAALAGLSALVAGLTAIGPVALTAIAAFTGLGGTLTYLSVTSKEFRRAFIKTMISAVSWVAAAFMNFKDTVKVVFYKLLLAATSFTMDIKHLFTKKLPAWIKWLTDNWRGLFRDLGNFIKTVAENIWENLKNLWEMIKSWLAGDGSVEFKWTGLTDGFESALSELPEIAKRHKTDVEKGLDILINESSDKIADSAKKIRAGMMRAIYGRSFIAEWFESFAGDMKNSGQSLASKLSGAFSGLFNKSAAIGIASAATSERQAQDNASHQKVISAPLETYRRIQDSLLNRDKVQKQEQQQQKIVENTKMTAEQSKAAAQALKAVAGYLAGGVTGAASSFIGARLG